MPHLHELTPGTDVKDVLVELQSIDAVEPGPRPSDPIYRATVRDATGYATLVYQASPACKPPGIKKGRMYLVSGARPPGLSLPERKVAAACVRPGRCAGRAFTAAALHRSLPPAGQVVSQKGCLQIRVTATWGRVERAADAAPLGGDHAHRAVQLADGASGH